MSIVIALDLGTTGNRAMAFDQNGTCLASEYRDLTQHFPQPGWVEHDPLEIWAAVQDVLNQVIQAVSDKEIVGIGITNQRETSLLWHRDSGQPIANAIVWQCRRTQTRCDELAVHASLIKAKTGLKLDPYFSASKIEWLLQNTPNAQTMAENGDLCAGTIDTWIIWQLTQGTVHATDVSNASRTMLYNIHTHEFDAGLMNIFNIPAAILPKVQASASHFGDTSPKITGKAIPITGVIGDQQAALFAQCGNQRGEIKNTYGTGLFIAANTGQEIPHTEALINTIAWQINDQVTYAMEGSVFIGGAAIQWLRDGLGLIESASETEALARSVPDSDGVIFVPALSGLGCPYWDPDARGMIIGITRGSTRAHLVRACLDALCYQTRDVLEEIRRTCPEQIFTNLKVDGGATQNPFLMQEQANILGMTVRVAEFADSTAWGAAGMAGIGAGAWSLDQFQACQQGYHDYLPDPSSEPNRDTGYHLWKKAVERCLDWA